MLNLRKGLAVEVCEFAAVVLSLLRLVLDEEFLLQRSDLQGKVERYTGRSQGYKE